MGLEVFGHGVAGTILIEDQRPDGSAILLQCAPYGAAPVPKTPAAGMTAATPVAPVPAGVAVASLPSGSWPMLQEHGVAHKRHGALHLDTTQMPGGVLKFDIGALAGKATDALVAGARFVQLTMSNAGEWGYIGPVQPPPVVEDVEESDVEAETEPVADRPSAGTRKAGRQKPSPEQRLSPEG
jgi:hypothetical protein